MFKSSYVLVFNRYNTRSQIELDIPLRKTSTGKQALSFLGLNSKQFIQTISFTHLVSSFLKNKLLFIINVFCNIPNGGR